MQQLLISRATIAAANASRRRHGVGELLTINPKIAKGDHTRVVHRLMHLWPVELDGYTMCSHATGGPNGCAAACLNISGHAAIGPAELNAALNARKRRTRWYIRDTAAFMVRLAAEINALIRRAEREGADTVAVRLNGTSDVPWQRVPFEVDGVTYPSILAAFPGVIFYDYSKRPEGTLPDGYRVTFSLSEGNDRQALSALARGLNVAVVMAVKKGQPLPATWGGYPVIDGDADDMRWLDPAGGHIIGLRPKGRNILKGAIGGFMRDPAAGFERDRKPTYAIADRRAIAAD